MPLRIGNATAADSEINSCAVSSYLSAVLLIGHTGLLKSFRFLLLVILFTRDIALLLYCKVSSSIPPCKLNSINVTNVSRRYSKLGASKRACFPLDQTDITSIKN